MPYNPYMVWDIDRLRHSELGGPRLHPRCTAMSGGDRCEYRVHTGRAHAAQAGGHRWIEDPLGTCSACGDPVYPLGARAWRDVEEPYRHHIVPDCCDDAHLIGADLTRKDYTP